MEFPLEEWIDWVEAGKIRASSAKVSPNGGLVRNLPRLRGSNLMQKILVIFAWVFARSFLQCLGWCHVLFTVVVVKVVGGFYPHCRVCLSGSHEKITHFGGIKQCKYVVNVERFPLQYRWWFRNPAPVEVGGFLHYLQDFMFRISSINSSAWSLGWCHISWPLQFPSIFCGKGRESLEV